MSIFQDYLKLLNIIIWQLLICFCIIQPKKIQYPRGAFLSYDPNIYTNSNSKVFGAKDIVFNKLEKTNNNLSGKIEFKDGNRNKYVFEFANLFKALSYSTPKSKSCIS